MTELPDDHLVTADLYIRPVDANDADALLPILNDPVVRRAFGQDEGTPVTPEMVADLSRRWEDGKAFAFTLTLHETSRIVGLASLDHLIWTEASGDFTICISASERRGGYGKQALRALITWAFDNARPFWMAQGGPGFKTLNFVCDPDNQASIQALSSQEAVQLGVANRGVVPRITTPASLSELTSTITAGGSQRQSPTVRWFQISRTDFESHRSDC